MHAIFNKKNITLCQTACRTDVVLQTFEMNLADKKVGPRTQAQAQMRERRRDRQSQVGSALAAEQRQRALYFIRQPIIDLNYRQHN